MAFLLILTLFGAYDQGSTIIMPPFRHSLGFYRASKFYIDLYLGDEFSIVNPQGLTGSKMEEEDDPATSSDDHILTLFGVNSGTGQILYNVKLTTLKVYGKPGSGNGEFNSPYDIAANPQGEVYVADAGNNRIVKLKYAKSLLSFDRNITDSFNYPMGVALDSRRNLYVADTRNNRIVVYDSTGTYRYSWTRDLSEPTSISVIDKDDIYNYYKEDYLIVIDSDNKRIQKFNLSGQLLAFVHSRMIGLSNAKFMYSAIDYNGNVFVTDMINNQIHKFDRFLNYIISVGRQGTGRVEFVAPGGIFIWKRFGQIFITDQAGGQYYWLATDGFFIGCFPSRLTDAQPQTTI
ncbi:MAG: NHL repeat-containing protein, partial [Candidatus Latescibacteria bacterium]|nr:NHL repeat-containing protein [Candidatus Latescibacterota bacterium]